MICTYFIIASSGFHISTSLVPIYLLRSRIIYSAASNYAKNAFLASQVGSVEIFY